MDSISRLILMLCVAMLVWGVACGDSLGGVERSFDPPGPHTVADYDLTLPLGPRVSAQASFVGKTTFNGQSLEEFLISYTKPSGAETVNIYGQWSSSGKFEIAGAKISYPVGEIGSQDYTIKLDKPFKVDPHNAPVGKAQTSTLSGTIEISGQPDVHITADTTWTRIQGDATVETKMGAVGGVDILEGQITVTESTGHWALNLVEGMPIDGTAWIHPTMGLLNFEIPILQTKTSFEGSHDCGNPVAGQWNTIQAVGLVGGSGSQFSLSTFDCTNEFDGDKNHHAKMLLELRFADGAMAQTDAEPMVNINFGTVMGDFFHILIPSPQSIFHPEENGLGYTFWYALVDQGAKNEPGDFGTSYHITVDGSTSNPIRAVGRIHYRVTSTY